MESRDVNYACLGAVVGGSALIAFGYFYPNGSGAQDFEVLWIIGSTAGIYVAWMGLTRFVEWRKAKELEIIRSASQGGQERGIRIAHLPTPERFGWLLSFLLTRKARERFLEPYLEEIKEDRLLAVGEKRQKWISFCLYCRVFYAVLCCIKAQFSEAVFDKALKVIVGIFTGR